MNTISDDKYKALIANYCLYPIEKKFNIIFNHIKSLSMPEIQNKLYELLEYLIPRSLDPKKIIINYHIGLIYLNHNRLLEAQHYYEKWLKHKKDKFSLFQLNVIACKRHQYHISTRCIEELQKYSDDEVNIAGIMHGLAFNKLNLAIESANKIDVIQNENIAYLFFELFLRTNNYNIMKHIINTKYWTIITKNITKRQSSRAKILILTLLHNQIINYFKIYE